MTRDGQTVTVCLYAVNTRTVYCVMSDPDTLSQSQLRRRHHRQACCISVYHVLVKNDCHSPCSTSLSSQMRAAVVSLPWCFGLRSNQDTDAHKIRYWALEASPLGLALASSLRELYSGSHIACQASMLVLNGHTSAKLANTRVVDVSRLLPSTQALVERNLPETHKIKTIPYRWSTSSAILCPQHHHFHWYPQTISSCLTRMPTVKGPTRYKPSTVRLACRLRSNGQPTRYVSRRNVNTQDALNCGVSVSMYMYYVLAGAQKLYHTCRRA
ncbi:hypothetical protein CONLIGDRAFT_367862 [Coniochaeta ligniaria NRRL 30616]|uniref:Uncharacterized protein n=1 Tax=Coniochaeta ligniaria NRRL 30616 TaxID=1408157 RepID=A0A1J7IM02_9PEZI|nr:hypothetical protein CONLIGDRAFT_367862 [Coniochaeta ligniaria NRRL 30616]